MPAGSRFVRLEGDASDWAAVCATGLHDEFSVASEQREDPFDGIVDSFPCRFQQHRADAGSIGGEDGHKHVLLAGNEVVQAAGVHVPAREQLRHGRGLVTLLAEQLHRRANDARPGVERYFFGFVCGARTLAQSVGPVSNRRLSCVRLQALPC